LGWWIRLIAIATAAGVAAWIVLTAAESGRTDVIAGQAEQLRRNAVTVAAVLAMTVSTESVAGGDGAGSRVLNDERAQALLADAVIPHMRLLLFDAAGRLIATSGLGDSNPRPLTPPSKLQQAYRALSRWMTPGTVFETDGAGVPILAHFPEVNAAIKGASAARVGETASGQVVLIVAVPVLHEGEPIGALVLADAPATGAPAETGWMRLGLALTVGLCVFGLSVVLVSVPLRSSIAALGRSIEQVIRRESLGVDEETGPGHVLAPLAQPAVRLGALLQARIEEADLYAREVAHEVKNPLSSLRSAVETAALITDPNQHKRLMEVIVQDVTRLDRLISTITDLSQVDSELAAMPVEEIDLAAMVTAIVEIENAASQSDWAPEFLVLQGGGPFRVRGAEARLAQVFRNLLANARSFSPPAGRIRVTLTRRENAITITCDDDGPGLPPDREETVFQRFYSDRPDSQPFAGHSGLGLSLCRQIVQAHRGTIWAENRLDPLGYVIGARFTIVLPAA